MDKKSLTILLGLFIVVTVTAPVFSRNVFKYDNPPVSKMDTVQVTSMINNVKSDTKDITCIDGRGGCRPSDYYTSCAMLRDPNGGPNGRCVKKLISQLRNNHIEAHYECKCVDSYGRVLN